MCLPACCPETRLAIFSLNRSITIREIFRVWKWYWLIYRHSCIYEKIKCIRIKTNEMDNSDVSEKSRFYLVVYLRQKNFVN